MRRTLEYSINSHPSVNIGGILFPAICYLDALEVFIEWIKNGDAHQVCIVNVHALVSAQRDQGFGNILRSADLCTMDGEPLRWYANLIEQAGIIERVCGPELMLHCLDYGRERGWKHFLLGGREGVLEQLHQNLVDKYPGVQIVGSEAPPFRPMTVEEGDALVKQINESDADFLWVGLGAPKQERWISENLARLNVPVNIGVGAAFDFHAENIARAPVWMQRFGLEWLFRLINDPRLWRRYLSTNPPFLWMLIWDYIKIRLLGIR